MTRQLFRSFVAMALAGAVTLAPVAPTFGQTQAPAPTANPGPAGAPTGAPGAAPAAMPAQAGQQPAQTPVVPVPVVPFQFARGRDYSLAPSWYPHVLRPYQQTQVDEPQFTNSPRIDALIKDGKLMLSLQDAVELALENNPDMHGTAV